MLDCPEPRKITHRQPVRNDDTCRVCSSRGDTIGRLVERRADKQVASWARVLTFRRRLPPAREIRRRWAKPTRREGGLMNQAMLPREPVECFTWPAASQPNSRCRAASAKAAKDGAAFVCKICRQTFMCNAKPSLLYLHVTAKHPDKVSVFGEPTSMLAMRRY